MFENFSLCLKRSFSGKVLHRGFSREMLLLFGFKIRPLNTHTHVLALWISIQTITLNVWCDTLHVIPNRLYPTIFRTHTHRQHQSILRPNQSWMSCRILIEPLFSVCSWIRLRIHCDESVVIFVAYRDPITAFIIDMRFGVYLIASKMPEMCPQQHTLMCIFLIGCYH